MDDGSQSVDESLELLKAQGTAGADTVVATPHFYANDESVASFLARRARAAESLAKHLTPDLPKLRLGAEVRYYRGISRLDALSDLRVENSRFLLLEMPFCEWSEYMLGELEELSCKSGFIITLAHIERYRDLQKTHVWERIRSCGIRSQVNADYFASRTTRRRAVSMLKSGQIQFIGSDCHNVTHRPPRLGEAYSYIEKKLGHEFICQMNEYAESVLDSNNI